MPDEQSMQPMHAMEPMHSMNDQKVVGHLYMQTNELQNAVVQYSRSANGAIEEVDRVSTGGAGSGEFKPTSGQESAPNAFEGAGSVILSPDRSVLFATNGGDNSVSSFAVADDGRLTLIDVCSTGNPVEGRSGTAKSLAYTPETGTLYVLHSFGPDHLRLISVDAEGKLTARSERYTVNTHDKPDRISTMVVLAPSGGYVFVGTTFDEPASANPDGSAILWVPRAGRGPGGPLKSIASNAPDPDGLAVFPVREDGALGSARFYDANSESPFYIAFLHNRPDTFVIGAAVGDGCVLGTIDEDGRVEIGELVKIDTSAGLPSELCWLSVSPDDRVVYATSFGYSNVSSFKINGNGLEIASDPACPRVKGDGTFRALNNTVSSGPSDSWLTPDGTYLYQIYANASRLVGYATQPDGSLDEVTAATIPYNSPQGLAGF
jgi:6-phosphogluconolactonase (cycloisomerase 2 family)